VVKRGGILYLKIQPSILGSLHVLKKILMVQSEWLITTKKIIIKEKKLKRKKKSWESPLPILLIERYSYVPHVYK
jgi:uncharacterized membrane protein